MKAMGVGLQLELGRAEFHTRGGLARPPNVGVTAGAPASGGVTAGGAASGGVTAGGAASGGLTAGGPASGGVTAGGAASGGLTGGGGGGGAGAMETASLVLDGSHRPKWAFFLQPLGEPTAGEGGGCHWVTVSRGPTEDVTDAHGEFRATWRKPAFTDPEWGAVLAAPSPFFSTLTVGDLVGRCSLTLSNLR